MAVLTYFKVGQVVEIKEREMSQLSVWAGSDGLYNIDVDKHPLSKD